MAPHIRSGALRTATSGIDPDHILVWGAVAMGGSIGAWLVRAGQPVRLVDTAEQRARVMRDAGLKIFGAVDEFSLDADCVHPSDVTSEITTVFLAVKAHHTEASDQASKPCWLVTES